MATYTKLTNLKFILHSLIWSGKEFHIVADQTEKEFWPNSVEQCRLMKALINLEVALDVVPNCLKGGRPRLWMIMVKNEVISFTLI